MCIQIFVINYSTSMFLTRIKTLKFTFLGVCPGDIYMVYIIMNKREI